MTTTPDSLSVNTRRDPREPKPDPDRGQDQGGAVVDLEERRRWLVPGSPGWRYNPGRVVEKVTGSEKNGDGEKVPTWTAVLAWCPVVRERLVVTSDAGKAAGRYYTVRVGDDELTVSHEQLAGHGEAWGLFPDATGTGSNHVRGVLLNIITDQASRLDRTRVLDRTGWCWLPDGRRFYVRADGRTWPAEAPIRIVGMPERLAAAAAPPPRSADADEVRAALLTIRDHGAPLLRGLGAGARSLGYHLRRVPAGWLFVGPPGSGKSGAVVVGRALVISTPSWPPVASTSFEDTTTQIERKVAREADLLALVDDAPLVADSTEAQVREVNAKLERVFRAAYNGGPMRDRAAKGPAGLVDAPANYVGGGVAGTLQQLPPTMQPSLYRRVVLVTLAPGQVDTAWLRDHCGELVAPLRALGDRIIARLAEPDAAALLERLDAEAYRLVGDHLGSSVPGGDLAELPRLHAADLAGLLLAAEVAGLDRAELTAPALEQVAADLAAQVRRAGNRRAAADDLAAAVGELVLAALHAHRAHVRRQDGTLALCVPGQTDTAHGYRARRTADGLVEHEGAGPAFYWLPAHSAVGGRDGLAVRAGELHTLLAASRDPRVRGIGREALAEELLVAGALVETTQKGKRASVQVKVEQARVEGGERARLVVLRPELVFDLPEPEPDGGTSSQTGGTGGTGGTAQVNGLVPGTPRAGLGVPAAPALTSEVPPVPPVPPPTGVPPSTGAVPLEAAIAASEAGEAGAGPGPAPGAPPPRVPATLDVAGLHLPGGQLEPVHDRSTAAGVALVARAAGARDVFVTAEQTRALGLEPARLAEQAEASPFLAPVGAMRPRQERLTEMIVCRHGDEREVTRLHLISGDRGARLRSLAGVTDGAELLRLVLRFEQLTGARWDGSASQTTAHLHRTLTSDAHRRALAENRPPPTSPGAYDPAELLPEPLRRGVARAPSWYRPIPAELAERFPLVVLVDQRANYLAVMDAKLPAKAPRQVGPGPLERLGRGGWALVRAAPWPDPASFDPLGAMRARADAAGAFWADLHTLRYAASAGVAVEVLDAWTFEQARPFLAPVKRRLRDALYALEAAGGRERDALAPLVKDCYREFVGWLAAADYHQAGDVLWRPDWRDQIVAEAAVVTHRKVLRAPGRVAAVQVDAIGVLLERDDPAAAAGLLGGQLGYRAGEFKAEGSWPSALHVLDAAEAADPWRATAAIRRRIGDWKRGGAP